MKKLFSTTVLVTVFIFHLSAQPWRGSGEVQLTAAQKAKVEALGLRLNALSPEEKEAMYLLRGYRRAKNDSKFKQLSADKQARVWAIKTDIEALKREERRALFQQFGGRPQGRRQ